MFDRPPCEDYVRTSVEVGRHTFEPAIEYREGDDYDRLVNLLDDVAKAATALKEPANPMDRAKWIGKQLARLWEDRAYFVEVWEAGRRGFAQSVQPFGFPRNQAPTDPQVLERLDRLINCVIDVETGVESVGKSVHDIHLDMNARSR